MYTTAAGDACATAVTTNTTARTTTTTATHATQTSTAAQLHCCLSYDYDDYDDGDDGDNYHYTDKYDHDYDYADDY